MCDKKEIKEMTMPMSVVFAEDILARTNYKNFIDKYNLEKIINNAYVNLKNNLGREMSEILMTFIGGSQAWRYLKNENNFPELDELEASSFDGTEFDIFFIYSTSYEDQYQEITVFIYENFIEHIITELKNTSTLCQESDEFCLQLNINGEKFNSVADIKETILGSNDIEAYIFTLVIMHKGEVLDKIFLRVEIMNIYSTPTDLFQIHQQKLVHPNYYLNKYGLAFFSHVFPRNNRTASFNVNLIRIGVLKRLFKNQSLLEDQPREFNIKADFSYYNYYIIIQKIYESFFKKTEIYRESTYDSIQSTAFKSVDVFKNAFDSLEERYVDILRPHINAFVVYLSDVLKEFNPENFLGLSGGDTYRRWSDIVKKTADIDTKLYLPFRQRKLIARLQQELILFSCHLKYNIFTEEFVKQFDVNIDNKVRIQYMIQKTNFRLRCYTKTIFPVNLYSIDARCMYKINNKRYSYDYSCLDVPIDTFKHIKKAFGFHTVPEYIPFPVNWIHKGDKSRMDIDIKNNGWVHYDKGRLFIPSPLLLKIDIEKIYSTRESIVNRELGKKIPKDGIRYNAVLESCQFYEKSDADENYKKTVIDQKLMDALNVADLNTYLFMCSINKTKTTSFYLETIDKHAFILKVMKLFGMFKLDEMMSKNFKYKLPFSFNTIEQKYKDLLIQKSKNPEAQKKEFINIAEQLENFPKDF